ncbi:hypothetical protein M426DRAFT_319853 [Hypoxylon sp. CI-4A]|nr:hypothetical protein M426DRAFT_319853 [Hypoxylon sp. CI-4A]
MSIQQLPEHVIAQIKSSTTITSLNSVVCGLVKNSLDAEATKINIYLDYLRGNCTVEDNGFGIPPSEFKSTGGIGKLHCTSKYPLRNDSHGRHGTFIASVAALSLLSVTSHHHGYHSHNSIKIHNAQVLARHTPSLPEQRLLSFPHGTRTTIRDLFGSMPVRVKQRAIDAERGANAKDWERLKRAIVALLLAWPGQISISLRDSTEQRTLTIRAPEAPPDDHGTHDGLALTTRVSRTLFQAQLCDDRSRDLWVPLKASAGLVSVVGAVSLVPIASRHLQFISIGVRPVPNEHGSNVLYEEINRLFANSSFGVEESEDALDEEERDRRAKDHRFKTDGYTNQELRGRKGVDRWPMFYIKINLGEHISRLAERDVEEIFDERHESLKVIIDILTAVVYEFLKSHHFRPRHSRPRGATSATHSNSGDRRTQPSSRNSTPTTEPRKGYVHRPRSQLSAGDLASTRLTLTSNTRQRHESPFDSWARIKSGQHQYAHLHEKPPLNQEDTAERALRSNEDDTTLESPLVGPDGTLLRIPFLDVDMEEGKTGILGSERKRASASEERPELREGEILWTNPTTKEDFLIDARTGLTIRPLKNSTREPDARGNVHRLPLRKKLRTNTEPIHRDEKNKWIGDLLSSWDNPVFQTQEPPIPVAFDEEQALAMTTKALEGCCHGRNSKAFDFLQASRSVEGRLSKDNLRNARVMAQVDRKFILAKVPLFSAASNLQASRGNEASLLVIIDQHAADERCRVEALMKYFFVADDGSEQLQQSFRTRTELLEKPIMFDISPQDSRQFEQSAKHFERWGIEFQVSPAPKSLVDNKRKARLKVVKLPPSIAERSRTEPRLLIELLRKEAWKLDEQGHISSQHKEIEANHDDNEKSGILHWLARFHGCPNGILEMINSRACRSAIMFNDPLSHDECVDLLKRLADCALPFQCAHGRPSMVPLVDLGNNPMGSVDAGKSAGSFGEAFKKWKGSIDT